MAIFVDKASASSIEWVVKMIELYFLFVDNLEITFHIYLLALGSIPVEGSSKKHMGGLPSIAMATESFRLFPPEYVPAQTFLNGVNSISSIFLIN